MISPRIACRTFACSSVLSATTETKTKTKTKTGEQERVEEGRKHLLPRFDVRRFEATLGLFISTTVPRQIDVVDPSYA